MNWVSFHVIAVAFWVAAQSVSALAANTITVNWHNNTSPSISRNTTYDACQPAAACNRPSSIASGVTGVLTNTATSSTYVRSMTARYQYTSGGITKSCQVTVSAYGPSST